jgi:hypothetical protein
MIELPLPLIEAFPPSSDLLLDRIRRIIDDANLVEIARADYGHMADEMLAELRPIRDQAVLPTPMSGQLIEVLELTRWCDPENPNAPPFEPGPTGLQGHRTRLFACAVMLRAAAERACQFNDSSNDSTLALCLASAIIVGAPMEEALACFLTWRLSRVRYPQEAIYLSLVLLILAIRLRPVVVTDQALGSLAECLLVQEALHRKTFSWNSSDPPPVDFSLQWGWWRKFAEEIRSVAEGIPVKEIQTNLQLCALLLEPA